MYKHTFSFLMMEAVRTSETSVDNHFTRQYNPEDNSEHHTRRRENLKSHIHSVNNKVNIAGQVLHHTETSIFFLNSVTYTLHLNLLNMNVRYIHGIFVPSRTYLPFLVLRTVFNSSKI
jgi:ATP:corrinoid adenosyltransferase